jgi:hypothetical protein
MAGLTGDRYDLTADNVAGSPEGKGVYQIERSDGTVIYIGQGFIRQRLLSHLRRENPTDLCVFGNRPTHYRRETCADAEAREKRLLVVTPTLCNQRSG